MTNLTYLPIEKLRLHPRNIRLYYPPEDVEEMAGSIKTVGGVLQALLVVPADDIPANGSGPIYYVVDGNMRLAAARTIDDCPPLKCEIITSNRAEQLLVMLTTTRFHYPKDRISLARHYQRLQEQEGLTLEEIGNAVGLSGSSISGTLHLLELDLPIQELIKEGKLTADYTAMRQLRRVPEAKTRIKLARRFAATGASARSMQRSIAHVLNQYTALEEKPDPKPPAVYKPRATPKESVSAEKLNQLASTHICAECRLDGLSQQCYTCPGPYEFINAVVDILPVEKTGPSLAEELPR